MKKSSPVRQPSCLRILPHTAKRCAASFFPLSVCGVPPLPPPPARPATLWSVCRARRAAHIRRQKLFRPLNRFLLLLRQSFRYKLRIPPLPPPPPPLPPPLPPFLP